MAAVVELLSGMPIGLEEEDDLSNTFASGNRPFRLRDPRLPSDRPLGEKLLQWFDTSAFAPSGETEFGNAPRTMPGGPGRVQIDMSVHKAWSLTERYRFLFRADFFNAPNHANFNNPDGSLGSESFGQIWDIASGSTGRRIQMSLRFEF